MKKLVNLLFLVTVTCINLNAQDTQEPFSCENSGTVISYVTSHDASSGTSNLALISILDKTTSSKPLPKPTIGVNSIGYNVKDDYIWGYNIPSKQIIRIGADNSVNYYETNKKVIPGEIKNNKYANAVDISPDGIMYLKADGEEDKIFRVNLDGDSDIQTVLDPVTLTGGKLNTDDFAFNPKDGNIYFIDKSGGFKKIVLDGDKGTVSTVKDVASAWTVIAAFDVDGNFYFNRGGDLYKLKISYNGSAMDVTSIDDPKKFSTIDDSLTQGDGARCMNAPMGKPELEPKKFECSQDAYLFSGKNPSKSYSIMLSDGTYKDLKDFNNSFINATGYSVKDDLIWGYDIENKKVVRIDANFDIKSYKVEGLPEGNYYAGDVSQDGFLYLKKHNDNNMYKININSGSPILEKKIPLKYNAIVNFGDFAFSPQDNMLYSINELDNHLFQINSEDGTMQDLGVANDGVAVEYHTFVFDKAGTLYFYGVKGMIYKIEIGKGIYTAREFKETEIKTAGGDGARCPNASMPEDEPVAFECNENSYLFSRKNDDSTTQSRVINLLTGDITTDKESFGNVGAGINAIGFNPVDGFIYGWSMGDYVKHANNSYPNGHLIKIDADYHVSNVNLVKPFETNSGYIYLGDVSKDGIYYLTGSHKVDGTLKVTNIKVIDLNTMTQLPDIELKFPVGIDDINNADFAINPIDDNLYVVNYNNSYEHNNQLLKIHLHGDNIGKVEELGRVIDDSHRVHSVFNFFDKYGNFYTKMSDNLAGSFYTKRPDTQSDNSKIYKIDISKPWSGKDDSKAKAKPFTDLTLKTSGDGARCALAGLSKKATLHIEEQQFKVPEGNKNGTDGTNGEDITITISSDIKLNKDVTIILGQLEDSTATKGEDYKSRPATELIFPKGSQLLKYTIRDVIADSKVENDETFKYLLGVDPDNNADASFDIDSPVVKINIIDDDSTTFTAFDLDADTHKKAKDKRIKTKTIGKEFKLILANINNPEDVEDVNRSTTKVKVVKYEECSKTIEQLDIDSYEKFVMEDELFGVTFDFTVDSAIKDAAVQFIWKDRRGIMRTSCSADRFAIKPKKFSFSYNSLEQARKATAGKPYGLSIYALSEEDQPSNPYNEENGVSFRIDANQSDPSKCSYNSNDFDDSNMTIFSNGILDGTIKYGDVGKLTIKVSEINGSEFAKVDENDTSWADRIITPESVEVEFRPDHFDINVSMDNKHTNSDYAFYSNDVDNSPTWMIQATAKDAGNKVLKNFDNTCQEKMVDLDIFLDINASDDLVLLSNIEENKDVESGTTSLKLDSNISSFTDGVGIVAVKFNFQRSSIVPLDPALLNMRKVDLEIVGENVTGTKVTQVPMQYQYMRTYIQDPIAVIGKNSITTEVYYETYESSSRSIFAIKGDSSKSGERNWYKVFNYEPKSGRMTYGGQHFMYGDTSSTASRLEILKQDNRSVKITATHLPEKNVVVLRVNDDFKTNDSGTIETHVTFKPDSVNWAGDGKTGMTVDNNVSTRVYKKMNW